jgi:hypothetical protein
MVVMAVFAGLLMVFAALALAASNDYLSTRQTQNAADASALAAGRVLAESGTLWTGPPTFNGATVEVAHDFAANNGFTTNFNQSCISGNDETAMQETWYDTNVSCGATTGFTTRVSVQVPPAQVPQAGSPGLCSQAIYRYNCFEVTVTSEVANPLGIFLGIPISAVTSSATVFADPPLNPTANPPGVAVYLWELSGSACSTGDQCFTRSAAASRSQLSCSSAATAADNCPTFWNDTTGSASTLIKGFDGSKAATPQDETTVQSEGDMLIQGPTTFCDPYNGAPCTGTSLGAKGFAVDTSGINAPDIYCSTMTPVPTSGLTGCTTSGQSNLKALSGSETTPAHWNGWTPTDSVSGLPTCGALVLNGDTVNNSFTEPGSISPSSSKCDAASGSPYQIEPGIYQYIVINHGEYEFDSGTYSITGVAPENTATGSNYTANGIDHSRETTSDFDLCTTGGSSACTTPHTTCAGPTNAPSSPGQCNTLTAGVWIGHGSGHYYPLDSGTAGTCANGTVTGGDEGGGGDPTIVTGNGVTFLFGSNSAGFVSTAEVQTISMSSPATSYTLFDMENNGWIHLDASSGSSSNFIGIIYQENTATAGGVEMDAALGESTTQHAGLAGQVLAYSFTLFGSGGGTPVDFSGGYSVSGPPPVENSGKSEPSMIGSISGTEASDVVYGTDTPSWATGSIAEDETLTFSYTDEWAMDAYDTYIEINGSSPIFFSDGVWNPTPGNGATLPPEGAAEHGPSDQGTGSGPDGSGNGTGPMYAAGNTAGLPPSTVPAGDVEASVPSAYKVLSSNPPDWILPITEGSQQFYLEVSGGWIWGHQKDLAGATRGTYDATLRVTFPVPHGSTVSIDYLFTDGDHCGDYASGTFTDSNVSLGGGAGGAAGGSVILIQ